MVFKEDQLCWYGYASTDNRIWTSEYAASSKRQLTPQQRIRQLETAVSREKLKTEFIQDVIYHIDKEMRD